MGYNVCIYDNMNYNEIFGVFSLSFKDTKNRVTVILKKLNYKNIIKEYYILLKPWTLKHKLKQ